MFKSLVRAAKGAVLASILAVSVSGVAGTVRAMRPPKVPDTYTVDGKTVGATEAILAYLKGATVLSCSEQEVQDTPKGPKLVKKGK